MNRHVALIDVNHAGGLKMRNGVRRFDEDLVEMVDPSIPRCEASRYQLGLEANVIRC